MIRRPVFVLFVAMSILFSGVVGSTPAGAVVDTAIVVSSPNPGTSTNQLYSVSCVSASDCVAVGYTNVGSAVETLVMVWDGGVWSVVASPNAGSSLAQLFSVSCVSATECVAVGFTSSGSPTETLVLSLAGPEPVPTPTTVPADQTVPAFTG